MSKAETRAVSDVAFTLDGGKPRIDAQAILYDSWSVDLGGFRERIMPGAVKLDNDLLALFDHATDKVLGRSSAGTMTARQDDTGVNFTAYPPNTTWAQDLRVSMERGDIKGCSFRMLVDKDAWYVQDGQVLRDVLECRVTELTVTSMPAYPETTAEARSQAKALATAPAKVQARVGKEVSDANLQVLKGVFQNLELASDTLEQFIAGQDPAFNEDAYGLPENDMAEGEGPDAGKTPGQHMVAGLCADCGNQPCTCGNMNSEQMDGASTTARSADGASVTPRPAQVFVPGFGFIHNTRKEK